MGKEIVYCEICGERILEEQFQKGEAVQVLNKSYCPACRGDALRVTQAERTSPFAGEAPAATEPAARPAPSHRPRRPLPTKPEPAPAPTSSSKLPLIVGGSIGLLSIVVLLFLVLGGNDKKAKKDPGAGRTGGDKTAGTATDDGKVQRARKAYGECEAYWKENASKPDEALTFFESKRADVSGSLHEKDFQALVSEAKKKSEELKSEAEIRNSLSSARSLIEKDLGRAEPEFDQYETITNQLANARNLARMGGLDQLVVEINGIEEPYLKRYEDAASEHYEKIYDLVKNLASLQKYDNAISTINTFPERYRKSKAWKDLENLRRDYEKRK